MTDRKEPFRILSMYEFERLKTTDERAAYLRRAMDDIRIVNEQIKAALDDQDGTKPKSLVRRAAFTI